MPDHLRALPVVLLLAAAVYAFSKAPACALASTAADFNRRRNLWFGITLTAFLAHNFWVYIVAAAVMLLVAARRETNKIALYYFVLFAVPPFRADIPGLGIVGHLFSIEYLRLLALTLLLPAFLVLRKQPDIERFGRSMPEKLLAGYLILQFALMLQGGNVTNALRYGIVYPFLGVFLPYYVASRSLRDIQQFRDALMAFAVAAMVLSVIGAFEFLKGWLLYAGVNEALGVGWGYDMYQLRAGGLRATASAGGTVLLGYVITVGLGFFLYLRKAVANSTMWYLGLLLLVAGLISSVSRGPWVGAIALAALFIAAGPSPLKGLSILGLLGIIALPVLLLTPMGEKFISILPFIGTAEQFNVNYRERLAQVSFQLILANPFFGTTGNFRLLPEMQELIQGQGIVDVVNTYAAVGMAYGLVGLSLFSGALLTAALGIFKALRTLPDKTAEVYRLGQALLATLFAIMVILATVSQVMVIPVVFWSVAGLGVAYAKMVLAARSPAGIKSVPAADRRTATGKAAWEKAR